MAGNLGTVLFVGDPQMLSMLSPLEVRAQIEGFFVARAALSYLREILLNLKELPKAVVVYTFENICIDLINSLVVEFPSLHFIYWYTAFVDPVPARNDRVHLFNNYMRPSDFAKILGSF